MVDPSLTVAACDEELDETVGDEVTDEVAEDDSELLVELDDDSESDADTKSDWAMLDVILATRCISFCKIWLRRLRFSSICFKRESLIGLVVSSVGTCLHKALLDCSR